MLFVADAHDTTFTSRLTYHCSSLPSQLMYQVKQIYEFVLYLN